VSSEILAGLLDFVTLFRSMLVRTGRLKAFVRGVDNLERIGVNGALRMGVVGCLEEILSGFVGKVLDMAFGDKTGDASFGSAF
jgi:hypothetical protein